MCQAGQTEKGEPVSPSALQSDSGGEAGKPLGQIAFDDGYRHFYVGEGLLSHKTWVELDEDEREAWEAVAQAVRLAVIEECKGLADKRVKDALKWLGGANVAFAEARRQSIRMSEARIIRGNISALALRQYLSQIEERSDEVEPATTSVNLTQISVSENKEDSMIDSCMSYSDGDEVVNLKHVAEMVVRAMEDNGAKFPPDIIDRLIVAGRAGVRDAMLAEISMRKT